MSALRKWFEESETRWLKNVGMQSRDRVSQAGWWAIGFRIPVDDHFAFQQLRNALVYEAVNSPFDFVEEPNQQDSCLVRPNVVNTRRWWCANRDVQTYCLQQYGDDWHDRIYGTTLVRRIGEIVDHAQRLARRINPRLDSIEIRLEWRGLVNRQLHLLGLDSVGDPAIEDAESLDAMVPISTFSADPQLLHDLTEPLFRAFRYRPDLRSVQEWLAER